MTGLWAAFRNAPIKRKLSIMMMLTAAAALAVACGTFATYDVFRVKAKAVEDLRVVAHLVGANCVAGLTLDDPEQIKDALRVLKADQHVSYAAITDADKSRTPLRPGKLIAEYGYQSGHRSTFADLPFTSQRFVGDHLELTDPITFDGAQIGMVYVQSDLAEARSHLQAYAKMASGVLLASLAFAFVLASNLQRVISRPVLHLAAVEKEVAQKRDFSLRATKIADDELGVLIDGFNDMLQEIQRRDAELRVAMRRAEEANETKSTFLANMSHELRTPLNAIIGYSEMLMEDADQSSNTALLTDLKKIHAAGKHLLALINDVLDISKIEAGRMELHLESFDLGALIDEVATTVRPLVAKNDNELVVECDRSVVVLMQSDVTKVRQVLLNLLSNAAKFTEKGTLRLSIDVNTIEGLRWVTIHVSDTGIGMTSAQLRSLFRAFAQADTSTSRRFGGTGLGLAISKRFCEMLGGEIQVSSEYGKGSLFTVRLPTNIAEQRLSVGKTEVAVRSVERGSAALPSVGEKLVLVIDDDPSARDLMARVLTRERFKVATAASGEEGVRLARDLRPDAITLDVILPGMSGWAVLSELKSDVELSDIPVVMLTMVDDKNRGIALGASDYVVKPIDREKLARLLRKFNCDHPPCTVLVVDDDPDQRARLRRLIEREGWNVSEAENGRAALKRIGEAQPSLILLDLMMPELDGFGFLREFRSTAGWPNVPIVVLTSKDLTAQDRAFLDGYVVQVMQKTSYSHDQLEREIASLLNAYIKPTACAKEAYGAQDSPG